MLTLGRVYHVTFLEANKKKPSFLFGESYGKARKIASNEDLDDRDSSATKCLVTATKSTELPNTEATNSI